MQVIALLCIAYSYVRVSSSNDVSVLVYTEQTSPFDPAIETVTTTVREHDAKQVQTLLFQTCLGVAIVAFMHLKWGYLRPLLLQSVLGLRTVFATPLVQVNSV